MNSYLIENLNKIVSYARNPQNFRAIAVILVLLLFVANALYTPVSPIPDTSPIDVRRYEVTQQPREGLGVVAEQEESQQVQLITLYTPDSYKIEVYNSGKYFQIVILDTPFEEVRQAAEQDFLNRYGISELRACQLDVGITVPYNVDPSHSGITYKLSFCEEDFRFNEGEETYLRQLQEFYGDDFSE